MFQTIIEQIKAWSKECSEATNRSDPSLSLSGMGLPTIMLFLWCICVLFLGVFSFDPSYTINFPRIMALIVLIYLAGKDYAIQEKLIASRKKE